VSVDFIVLGLPRSGTTWLANWLTTDRSFCLHDPFNQLPERWPRDSRRFGISCTGAYLLPKWLDLQHCPVAIIERDPKACDHSLERIGLGDTSPLVTALRNTEGRRWRFDDIWNEEKARELWAFLLPDAPFDALRYRLLREMRIEPMQWTADTDVTAEVFRRYSQGEGPCHGAQ
jgi:hypothetical protein